MARAPTYGETLILPKRRPMPASETTDVSNNLNRRSRCSIPRTNMMLSAPGTRKRVNPDSLAARLGPELVKELEALLEPGMTEMPPFSVRQAIQKRYNIDRRHVYDWFHSKGLRVTKDRSLEDESRTSSLEPQRTVYRCLTPASTPSMSSCGTSYGDTGSDVSTPNMLLTPVNGVDAHDVFATGAGSYQAEAKSAEHRLYAPSFHRNGHYDDLLASTNLVSTPGLTPGNLWDQDVFCTEHKLIPQTETETQDTGANTLPAETTKENIDPLFAFDGRSLSQAEREAIYDSLSSVLGPACGIQESVGTYKAFMTKQSELYYERLLSGDISPSICQDPLENSLLYVDPSPLPGTTSCFSGYEPQPHEQNSVPLVPSTPQDLTSQYYSWLLHGGHSYPASLLPSFSPASNARSDTTMDISRSDTTLDITEILSSPVLEPPLTSEHGNTLNHNSAPDRHFGQGALYEMIPGYQALGFSVAPVYRPMVLHHMQSGRDEHVIQYAHLPMAAMAVADRIEASLTLQSAKAAHGLEKTVQDKSRSKTKGKNRVGGHQQKRSSIECIGGKK